MSILHQNIHSIQPYHCERARHRSRSPAASCRYIRRHPSRLSSSQEESQSVEEGTLSEKERAAEAFTRHLYCSSVYNILMVDGCHADRESSNSLRVVEVLLVTRSIINLTVRLTRRKKGVCPSALPFIHTVCYKLNRMQIALLYVFISISCSLPIQFSIHNYVGADPDNPATVACHRRSSIRWGFLATPYSYSPNPSSLAAETIETRRRNCDAETL